jgi:hypothetical protein
MKLLEYSNAGVTLHYAFMPAKAGIEGAPLVVVVTNPLNKDKRVEFLFNLNSFQQYNRIFIANDAEYGAKGGFLLKTGSWVIRDAVIGLIEKYRTQADILNNEVYLLGYCGACVPCAVIAFEKGYNAIISMFLIQKHTLRAYINEIPLAKDLAERWDAARNPQGIYYPSITDLTDYRGLSETELKNFMLDYISALSSQQLKTPYFYLHYGRHEERFRIDGRETLRLLDKLGVHYEAHIDEETYGHLDAAPYFVNYFQNILKCLSPN